MCVSALRHTMRMERHRTSKYILEMDHKPTEWHLFIDSSKHSMKAVLLYNGVGRSRSVGKRARGRSRKRWIENIEDLRNMGIRRWRRLYNEWAI